MAEIINLEYYGSIFLIRLANYCEGLGDGELQLRAQSV